MKQIQAHKFSDKFIELLSNENKILDINEYDYCITEWSSAHESKMIRYYIYTIILLLEACGLYMNKYGSWQYYCYHWQLTTTDNPPIIF